MKKLNYVYAFLFLVFLSLMSEGFGWNNASVFASFAYNKEYRSIYGGYDDYYDYHKAYWEMYDFNYDYSSHDWIADEALRMCETSPYFSLWTDANNKPFWDGEGRRRKIFLYATAGPDWGPMVCIESKLGNLVRAEYTQRYHHYYFDEDKKPAYKALGNYAWKYGLLARMAISEGDCDLGAFFLGQMAHYIADSCLYYHTIEPNDRVTTSPEGYMSSRMDSCPGVYETSTKAAYDILFRYEFLELTTTPLLVYPESPDICVQIIAYDAAFDSEPGQPDGTYTAPWMDQTRSAIPANIHKAAATRTDWTSWSNAMPVGESTPYYNAYHYFKRLEESVDLGVWFLANAMTWVINGVGTYKCSLGVSDLKESVGKQATLGVIFMMLSYLGINLIETFFRSTDPLYVMRYASAWA